MSLFSFQRFQKKGLFLSLPLLAESVGGDHACNGISNYDTLGWILPSAKYDVEIVGRSFLNWCLQVQRCFCCCFCYAVVFFTVIFVVANATFVVPVSVENGLYFPFLKSPLIKLHDEAHLGICIISVSLFSFLLILQTWRHRD